MRKLFVIVCLLDGVCCRSTEHVAQVCDARCFALVWVEPAHRLGKTSSAAPPPTPKRSSCYRPFCPLVLVSPPRASATTARCSMRMQQSEKGCAARRHLPAPCVILFFFALPIFPLNLPAHVREFVVTKELRVEQCSSRPRLHWALCWSVSLLSRSWCCAYHRRPARKSRRRAGIGSGRERRRLLA